VRNGRDAICGFSIPATSGGLEAVHAGLPLQPNIATFTGCSRKSAENPVAGSQISN